MYLREEMHTVRVIDMFYKLQNVKSLLNFTKRQR